jgi:hypothetical protein
MSQGGFSHTTPPSPNGMSKLEGRAECVSELLALHISKASIAKITGGDRATLYHFIRSHRLV